MSFMNAALSLVAHAHHERRSFFAEDSSVADRCYSPPERDVADFVDF